MDAYFFTIKHDYISEMTKIKISLLKSQYVRRLDLAANNHLTDAFNAQQLILLFPTVNVRHQTSNYAN